MTQISHARPRHAFCLRARGHRSDALDVKIRSSRAFVVLGLTSVAILAAFTPGCRRKHAKPVADPNGVAMTATPTATAPIVNAPPPTATVTAPTTVALPQTVGDADRAAARDLYNEGVALQQKSPQDALDKFERSYKVYAAPTTYLHLVQCQVALGKLVEAAEGYRALARLSLPAGSSKPFYDAQATASQELAALEPRIPRVKISVTPGDTKGLGVALDGLTYNTALLGIARPIDPGTHKLVVTAPGFIASEQTLDVKERDQKDVSVVLKKR